MEKSTYKELSDELIMLRKHYKETFLLINGFQKEILIGKIRDLDSRLKDMDNSISVKYPSGGDYNAIEKGRMKQAYTWETITMIFALFLSAGFLIALIFN